MYAKQNCAYLPNMQNYIKYLCEFKTKIETTFGGESGGQMGALGQIRLNNKY